MKMRRGGVEPTCENMPWTSEVDYHNDNIIMDGGKWKEWNGGLLYPTIDRPIELSTFPPFPLLSFVI